MVILVILTPILIAVVAVGLPFLAIGLLEALALATLAVAGLAAATLFGRPILVRAVAGGDAATQLVWAVKGWRASRRVRDRIVAAIRTGADPRQAAGAEAHELQLGAPSAP